MAADGVIETIYSLVYPETRVAFDHVRGLPDLPEMYERAWTKRQDPMHTALLDGWCDWTAPVVGADWHRFGHRYVAAGSSEAIRDHIARHLAAAHAEHRAPQIHVFEGEYEGYAAYAAAHNVTVRRHDRRDYASSLQQHARAGDRFYLSAPSSIDGMVWPGYDAFVEHLAAAHPEVKLAVDLCYVGCVGSGPYRIDCSSPNIDTVFFSLSKVFGVYYHRIGGVLSTDPLPGLHGNVWFKNLLSIRFGVELMNRHGPLALPTKYRPVQEAIVDPLRSEFGDALTASDVVLLAHAPGPPSGADEAFRRCAEGRRFCLTPALDAHIRGAQ